MSVARGICFSGGGLSVVCATGYASIAYDVDAGIAAVVESVQLVAWDTPFWFSVNHGTCCSSHVSRLHLQDTTSFNFKAVG